MKLVTLFALAASGLIAASASAQQLPTPKVGETIDNPQFIGGDRDYKGYQFTKLPEPRAGVDFSERSGEQLLAGTEMVNTLSGKEAYVSGIVSVLMDGTDIDALAQQFGLTVERLYGRLNLALLRAPEGTEMLQLRRDMMAFTGVNNVDIEIVEDIREPHVIK
ncbi:hypothetical protein C5610_02635 [Idiomarina sp. OT37-5b]|jgi:hypothetical protein|uniref:ASP external chaperone domain-containing protein n=1 Tax=Idiomarina aquatica TaxID=1327752 RepID=A0AA94EHG0_9GAMM|nr:MULTISPECIES: hypothetical protein [Idiomarina]AVJ55295.1 hypothetical protein C5610_02635 [Idiomarina sp. OT37-5b]RUO45134.1 hypothetical protein CWE23_03700 [Idiomarina aquatica]